MTFFMTALFMILVFWRPQEWLLPGLQDVPLLDIVVYVGLLGLLIDSGQRKTRIPSGPVPKMLAGLWFASMMSHIANGYFQGLMDTIPETGKICFFSLMLLCVLDRPSRARAVAAIFVGAACLMAFHALMQDRLGYGFADAPPLYTTNSRTGEHEIRTLFFGIFSDPNDMAQLLATSMPLVFVIPKRQNVFTFLVAAGIVTFLMFAFLTTHSRGGMVAVVSICCTLLILRLPPRWMPHAMTVALLGGLVMVALQGSAMLDQSALDRVTYWGLANRVFLHHPLFGLGYGMFWQVTGGAVAHNAFVSCYTEMGLFGYWFWFGLILLGILGCWRSRVALVNPQNEEQAFVRRLAGLSLAAMVGFCASAFYLSRAWVYPFFFLIALLNAVPFMAEAVLPEKTRLMGSRRDLTFTCTVGAVGSIVYIYVVILLLNRGYYG